MTMYTQASTLVVLVDTGRTDRYGNPVSERQETAAPCWYTHQATAENDDLGEQQTGAYLVQWPIEYAWIAGTHIDAVHLEPLGVFHVLGEVMYQPGGFAVEGYVQARVERVTS